ncbi:Lipopolysaccharide-assembly, LptC-related [Sulfitobacter sp. THAF37]|uniref:LPS export ABC transporter periplasmic protein LptC n=1 Tax=Sulfitobacter sp. THAF37 TaxID=2587855 RepID=UPI00126891B5|nr:LPS export ABC transporter periplasmic protein LptC [Sulfitobacter sp. THAF37]QFT58172.1 Lipopolysaccharide-assembly, LptC-related [Sulfitobacter sp. THAF37]
MQADLHSRMVSLLKVLFPLLALALLSTLFLLSRKVDPDSVIPFADKEIQDRLRDQQVTGPFFSGTTADGDQISFSAEKLTTPQNEVGANRAEDVRIVMDLAGGTNLTLNARVAHFELPKDRAELEGNVVIETSTDYRIESDRLTTQMTELDVRSPGPVQAQGPMGTLNAGSMTIASPEQGQAAQLIFKDGVKLVYNPKLSEK